MGRLYHQSAAGRRPCSEYFLRPQWDDLVGSGDELDLRGWIHARPSVLIRVMKLLVVDDESHARSDLIQLCERNDDVDVIGEAESGLAAIDAAERLRPDVMLLDVELPDMSGFDVLCSARMTRRPLGIMVTARADHAVTAFAVGALDCLVKPVSADRFDQSIERARQRCDSTDACDEVARSPFKLLIGEREHRLYPMSPETIDYIKSDGNYVTIRRGNANYISRNTLKRLSTDLAHVGFIRIERSLLVNIRAVAYVETVGRGMFAFTLSSGSVLHSSSSYRDSILRMLPMRRLSRRT
jgi:two-component system, LytTR family, response regulator